MYLFVAFVPSEQRTALLTFLVEDGTEFDCARVFCAANPEHEEGEKDGRRNLQCAVGRVFEEIESDHAAPLNDDRKFHRDCDAGSLSERHVEEAKSRERNQQVVGDKSCEHSGHLSAGGRKPVVPEPPTRESLPDGVSSDEHERQPPVGARAPRKATNPWYIFVFLGVLQLLLVL